MRKIIIIITIAISSAAVALFLWQAKQQAVLNPQISAQILPWQIEIVNGNSRVFGLMLGVNTLADVVKKMGSDYEVALLAQPDHSETLELYSSNFRSAALTGSIIVVAAISPNEIQQLRGSLPVLPEHLETGAKKTTLRFEQQTAALAYPIKSIMFIPVAGIDKALLLERFGSPAMQLQTDEKVVHYLYPNLGLNVSVDEAGRDFFLYVSPFAFAEVQKALQVQAENYIANNKPR